MKKILICLLLIICLSGCGTEKIAQEKTLEQVMKGNNYVVIDVRTEEEFLMGHVKEALNIPYDEINADTKLDKNKPILVYCRSGARSKKAFETLKSLGYNVYDLGAFETITLPKE